MKKSLLTFILFLSFSALHAQTPSQETCLQQYKKVFKERGADHVPDGMHRRVVVSITTGNTTDCYLGKARVEGTKVTAIFVQFEDDSYELFEGQDFKVPYGSLIKNGISEPWLTKEDNMRMQVIFTQNIQPKKKKFKKAPAGLDPSKL